MWQNSLVYLERISSNLNLIDVGLISRIDCLLDRRFVEGVCEIQLTNEKDF